MFVIGGYKISSSECTRQGEPNALAINAIVIIPLVLMITQAVSSRPDKTSKVFAYVDYFTAGGFFKDLINHQWKTLSKLGPKFGYYPEASKLWLIMNK